ncbi:YdcF family protein [Rhodoferax sp.]|uniref:YdcF family protein n=1 Tax=Rhodoferax sp. TaxID=50421 RepID=UPI00283FC27F|nr:YdcF family protein [Rhodoferax sp.]MDR3368730.1 YdcF family protein [Rhodoferax sp.]
MRANAAALALLLLLGWEPLPDAALRHLERQYPAASPTQDWSAYTGVIVLGGALEPAYVWTVPGQSALNEAAERMTEVAPLIRHQPHLKVLFTGGEGELFATGLSEAERARLFFQGQGLPSSKLLLESASRTTYDNAVMSKQLPGVDATKPWLLLTSAYHMPRAMAVFRKAGWTVTAYPVDFRTGLETPWTQYAMDEGVKKWRVALHEMLGLLAYELAGRA